MEPSNQDSSVHDQEQETISQNETHQIQVQQQSVICQSVRRPVRTITATGHITTMDPQEVERETVVEHSSESVVIQRDDDAAKEEVREYDTVSEGR